MPSKSAQQIRDEIADTEKRVGGLTALGLWHWMRQRIETSSHEGHLQIGGLAGTLERVCTEVRRSPDRLRPLLRPLTELGLVSVNDEGVFLSTPLKQLREALRKDAEKQARRRARLSAGGDAGVISPPKGGDAGVTVGVTVPPMVSLPTPLSSLSPSLHIPGVGGGNAPVPDDLRRATLQAFDLWSRASRNRPVVAEQNEHRPLLDLLEVVMQDPPIARGREVIPRQNLVPLAAEFCRLDRREFKGAKYAAATVRNLLDDWALKGIPGSDGSGSGRPPSGSRSPAGNGAAVATLDRPKMRRF